jgi:hypothetical protein
MANEFQELKLLAQTKGWTFSSVKDGYEIYQKEKKEVWFYWRPDTPDKYFWINFIDFTHSKWITSHNSESYSFNGVRYMKTPLDRDDEIPITEEAFMNQVSDRFSTF